MSGLVSEPGSPSDKVKDDYHQAVYELDVAVSQCVYCHRRKARKLKLENEQGQPLLGLPTECEKHRNRYRLIYTSSPVSETYWSS